MTSSHSSRHNKRYWYYTCTQAQTRGWDACPTKSVPAEEIEKLVLEQVRALGTESHPHGDRRPNADPVGGWHHPQPPGTARVVSNEQSRLVQLLVAGVDLDGVRNKITSRFHDHGIEALAQELKSQHNKNQA